MHGAEALVHAAGHAGRLGDGVGVDPLGGEEARLGLDLVRVRVRVRVSLGLDLPHGNPRTASAQP